MRIELWILLIAVVWVANVYTDGKYLKMMYKWKKLYQIGGIILGALFLYFLIKKNPMKTGEILRISNDYLKYLPMDKNSTSFISPILDFTSRQNLYAGAGAAGASTLAGTGASPSFPVARMPPTQQFVQVNQENSGSNATGGSRLMNSGKNSNKRSVSETKKKFVASRQNWHCGHCNKQISAWFEVDHKIRLEYGGDNHIDNLVALCRECHGEKTAMENL